MQQLVLVLHVLAAICLIVLVLMQHGKGADVGAAFGSGSANTMFGSSGSAPFLLKITALLGAVFFITSLTLNYMVSHQRKEVKFGAPKTQQTVPQTAPVNNAVVPPATTGTTGAKPAHSPDTTQAVPSTTPTTNNSTSPKSEDTKQNIE